ncbi:hypothetical protein K439DRAFT_1635452 [Ramaria rubella]|nr:hypothetical protein K439DRAFT_1635452 [Ramaria rubella]
MTTDAIKEIITAGERIQATKYYLVAILVVLVYEHLITFSDEVRLIWWPNKQNLVTQDSNFAATFAFYLGISEQILYTNMSVGDLFIFQIERHSVRIYKSFTSPASDFIRYLSCRRLASIEPLGLLTIALLIADTLLLLRVYALYHRSKRVGIYLGTLILCQVVVDCVLLTFPGGGPLDLPAIDLPVFNGCLFIPSARLGRWPTLVLLLEILYDTSIFSLIIVKTWREVSLSTLERRGIAHLLVKDGAFVIFSMIGIWTFMNLFSPISLKDLNGPPSSTMMAIMTNRLTLNIHDKVKAPLSTTEQASTSCELSTIQFTTDKRELPREPESV